MAALVGVNYANAQVHHHDHANPLSTPSRAAGPSRVDTEGRRSRFRSPPPPPIASPSLLLSTPGWYAKDATCLFTEGNGLGCALEVDKAMPVPKAPIFSLEKPHYPCDLPIARTSSNTDRHIRLHGWSIRFAPVKTAVTINDSTSELTHWVIASGVRRKETLEQVSAGGAQEGETWHSSLIHKRLTATLFETASGSTYELVGPANEQAMLRNLSSSFACRFNTALPPDWVDLTVQEARQRRYTKANTTSRPEAPVVKLSLKGGKLSVPSRKRKRRTEDRIRGVTLLSDISSDRISPPAVEAGKEEEQGRDRFSPHRSSSAEPTTGPPKRPKGIARELKQLQTSKFGNLALVQEAIVDELQSAVGKMKHLESQDNLNARSQSKGAKNLQSTPLRVSSRARHSMSEWWKVKDTGKQLQVKEKVAIPLTKCEKVVTQQLTSPLKSHSQESELGAVSTSEDEFQRESSEDNDEIESPKKKTSKKSFRRSGKQRAIRISQSSKASTPSMPPLTAAPDINPKECEEEVEKADELELEESDMERLLSDPSKVSRVESREEQQDQHPPILLAQREQLIQEAEQEQLLPAKSLEAYGTKDVNLSDERATCTRSAQTEIDLGSIRREDDGVLFYFSD